MKCQNSEKHLYENMDTKEILSSFDIDITRLIWKDKFSARTGSLTIDIRAIVAQVGKAQIQRRDYEETNNQ